MASSGIFGSGGIVQFGTSLFATDDDPMDTVIMRDGVHHGLHHGADSMAQVRVNYMGIGDDVVEGHDQFATIDTPLTVSDWYVVGGAPFGEWPLTVRASGDAYRMRIRIAGSVDATPATATFRVFIRPASLLNIGDVTEPIDSVVEATFTTTTPTWATGAAIASQGAGALDTEIIVSNDQVRGWIRDVAVYDAVSSPTDHSVQQCLVSAYVVAKVSDIAKLPQLNALHIQEHIG